MRVTLRQILYFDALVQERHFGRAAARVSVTQPAMSAQIREIETLLGGQLVDRSHTRFALTPLGRAVAERGRLVLESARNLEALAQTSPSDIQIRLGLIPTVAPYLVPAFIALTSAAEVSVTVSEALTARLLEQIQAGDIDAAVIALPSGQPDLVDMPLFEDRFLLAMPDQLLRPDWIAPARPEEISPERLVLLDDGHCLADQALSACALRRDHLHLSLGATSLTTVSRLVASGQGITLIPELAADVEGHGLNLSRFADPEPGRTIGLVTRRGIGDSGWIDPIKDMLINARRYSRFKVSVPSH